MKTFFIKIGPHTCIRIVPVIFLSNKVKVQIKLIHLFHYLLGYTSCSCDDDRPLLASAGNYIYIRLQLSLLSTEQMWENVFSFLTGTVLLRVAQDVRKHPIVFQSDLVQVVVERPQQRVHVSLVRLQHQLCHTGEGLEGGGSGKTAKK